jgi:hypothetical protein
VSKPFANVSDYEFRRTSALSIGLVRIKPPVKFRTLLVSQGKSRLIGCDAVPQFLDQP